MKYQGRPWKSVGLDIFTINNMHCLFIVERMEGFSADNLIFSEYGLSSTIVSDKLYFSICHMVSIIQPSE